METLGEMAVVVKALHAAAVHRPEDGWPYEDRFNDDGDETIAWVIRNRMLLWERALDFAEPGMSPELTWPALVERARKYLALVYGGDNG
jgi:hypothetical protein